MKADPRHIERLFDGNIIYQVPLFQRPYVWEQEEHWAPLWENIYRLAKHWLESEKLLPHFMGAVVFEQLPNQTGEIEIRQVIDGQQRLTTMQLFLIAMHDWLRSFTESKEAGKIAGMIEDLVTNSEKRWTLPDDRFKVWPTNSDRSVFRAVMTAGSKDAVLEIRKSLGKVDARIPEAYLFFYDAMAGFENNLAQDAQEIVELLGTQKTNDYNLDLIFISLWKVVQNSLLLVVIDLDQDDESQVIFETLNARGAQLLPADLMKNYLFRWGLAESEPVEELYEKYWRDFDADFWRKEIGTGRAKRPRVDVFVQHYLAMHTRDDVRVAHLFNDYKQFVENYEPAEDDVRKLPNTAGGHIRDLARYGAVYRGFSETEPESRLGLFLDRMEAVGTTTVYPVLLEVCNTLANDAHTEMFEIIGMLESFLVRRMVCNLSNKSYPTIMAGLLRNGADAGRVKSELIRSQLLKSSVDSVRFPTDAEFEAAFLTRPLYSVLSQAKVRMLLIALDRAIKDEKSEHYHYRDTLWIEHIMPQKWDNHWPLVLKDTSDEAERIQATTRRDHLKHSIGNLTLITQKLNVTQSNRPWREKQPELVKYSKLNLNRYFYEQDAWDEAAIEARAIELMTVANRIWPYPN